LAAVLTPAWALKILSLSFSLSLAFGVQVFLGIVYAGWTTALIIQAVTRNRVEPIEALAVSRRWFWRVFFLELIGWGVLFLMLAVAIAIGTASLAFAVLLIAICSLIWNLATAALLPVALAERRSLGASLGKGLQVSWRKKSQLWLPVVTQMVLLGWATFIYVSYSSSPRPGSFTTNTKTNWSVNGFWTGGYENNCRWYAKLMETVEAEPLPLISSLLGMLFAVLAIAVKLRIVAALPERKEDLQHGLHDLQPSPEAPSATAVFTAAKSEAIASGSFAFRFGSSLRRHPLGWSAGLVAGVGLLVLLFQQQHAGNPPNKPAPAFPLHDAAAKGDRSLIERLLQQHVKVDERDGEGSTPLMQAAYRNHAAIVEMLLAHGANINARHSKGWTALQVAARAGAAEVVPILLAKGAEVNTRDNEGQSPLQVAAAGGHSSVVSGLLKAGADLNMRDKTGINALGFAVAHGRHAVVDLLAARGAEDLGTLALLRGYELARAGNWAKALPLLTRAVEARKQNPGSGAVWYFTFQGWHHELTSPEVASLALLGECYDRCGQKDRSRESFAAALAAWPQGANELVLYNRTLMNQPGLEIRESYQLARWTLEELRQGRGVPGKLSLSRRETRSGGGVTNTMQSGGQEVSGFFQ